MWPSIGASAEARLTTPMTMRIIGKVLLKDKKPPRIWSRRNSKPTVVMTAGPIKLRMVQRRHAQPMRLLIEVHPPKIHGLGAVAETITKQQDADANQNQRPQAPYKVKRKPIKIVQKKKRAKRDQNNRTHGPVFAPGLQRIRCGFAEAFCFGGTHGVKSHIKDEARKKKRQSERASIAWIAAQADNNRSEDDDVDQGFVVLAVVNRAQARKQAEKKCDAGAAPSARRSSGRGNCEGF